MPRRPTVVAFDVFETMFSLGPMELRLGRAGLPAGTFRLWFTRLLRDAFALEASGDYRPFRHVAASTLEAVLWENSIDPKAKVVEDILGGFAELEPHPDADPALETLRRAGVRAITLTNGAASSVQSLLKRTRLDGLVERSISIDEVRHWKPHPAPYLHAATTCGVRPDQMALVSAHAWDILGAHRAGLTTGWASRLEGRFPIALGRPDISGRTLVEVIEGLLTLPSK